MQLADKTILITGATDGGGRKVAVELGKRGAKILLHGRNPTSQLAAAPGNLL